jgi:hypothetical protein
MNTDQLRATLQREGFDPRAYQIGPGHDTEVYVIMPDRGGWVTFYSERGHRTGEKFFTDESAACADLLATLRRDVGPKRP